MNAATIITANMTLDEKLAAIDAAIAISAVTNTEPENIGAIVAPLDPQTLLMCDGCQ